jgi:hypothetical protein
MRILPPRRLSATERERIEHRIAADPEVARALFEVLAARPQFGKKPTSAADIQSRSEG